MRLHLHPVLFFLDAGRGVWMVGMIKTINKVISLQLLWHYQVKDAELLERDIELVKLKKVWMRYE